MAAQKVYRRDHADVLLRWISELFCDAFAIAASGPNYRFAAKDLAIARLGRYTFTPTHPADLLRQNEQTRLLEELGWTTTRDVEGVVDNAFVEQIRAVFGGIADASDEPEPTSWDVVALHGETGFPEANTGVLVEKLIELCPRIRKDASECINDANVRAQEFWLLGVPVQQAFNRAIVPSTIIVEGEVDLQDCCYSDIKGAKRRYHPRPSTVMNGARVIYQTRCQELIDIWPGARQNGQLQHEVVQTIHQRLSEWTRKAVADWLLFVEGKREDGSSKD